MSNINFFYEEVDFKLKHKKRIIQWIQHIVETESKLHISSINYIFCSDPFLHRINAQYLKHDTLTDIITFNNSETSHEIDADIYISIDRIKENSHQYKKTMENELHRVMIHGILHLLGYFDKSSIEKKMMRKKEDECLTLLNI
jgi:rRNA maturation RNase YbeY